MAANLNVFLKKLRFMEIGKFFRKRFLGVMKNQLKKKKKK